jgi:hypothetical protein
MSDPRYPVGKYEKPATVDAAMRARFIDQLAATPSMLRAAVSGLDDHQLDTPYRDGGWTVRQVVHHVPDSHMNAYIRTKWALTEDKPTIKPYDENSWANLPEAKGGPIEMSLSLLEAVHRRWVACIRGVSPDLWSRQLMHPESGVMSIDQLFALYSWHGRHHVAHITSLRKAKGW